MAKRYARRRMKKAGLPPGTLMYTGEKTTATARITLFDFTEQQCNEKVLARIDDALPYKDDKQTVTWIDIDGLNDVSIVQRTGELFAIHPLVLEDILNTDQRPKLEDNGDYLYLVVKMLSYDEKNHDVGIEQVSFILAENYLISFQDKPGDVFEPVRNRIRQSRGRIRRMGTDHVLYALLDAIVDNYFVVLDKISDKIEAAEVGVAARPREQMFADLHAIKRELIFVRKALWPLRDVITALRRVETALMRPESAVYLRDLNDHVLQATEAIDTSREILAALLDVHFSNLSNRTNSIMKVLALFSSIFMPLTFITGIFGMNFRYFPELEWKYGFVGVMILMTLLAVAMLMYFRRKKWI